MLYLFHSILLFLIDANSLFCVWWCVLPFRELLYNVMVQNNLTDKLHEQPAWGSICEFWSKKKEWLILCFTPQEKYGINFLLKSVLCLVGFLTSPSTTRLYPGRAPRQTVWQFYVLPHMRQSHDFCFSRSPTQQVGRGQPQPELNQGSPHQESPALPPELKSVPIKFF